MVLSKLPFPHSLSCVSAHDPFKLTCIEISCSFILFAISGVIKVALVIINFFPKAFLSNSLINSQICGCSKGSPPDRVTAVSLPSGKLSRTFLYSFILNKSFNTPDSL